MHTFNRATSPKNPLTPWTMTSGCATVAVLRSNRIKVSHLLAHARSATIVRIASPTLARFKQRRLRQVACARSRTPVRIASTALPRPKQSQKSLPRAAPADREAQAARSAAVAPAGVALGRVIKAANSTWTSRESTLSSPSFSRFLIDFHVYEVDTLYRQTTVVETLASIGHGG